MKRTHALIAVLVVASSVNAQDKVTFRERGVKGGVQVINGKIDSESVAGVKIGARTISSADIIDVQYDVPPSIKLDYPKAVSAENKSPVDAIKEYDSLLKNQSVQNSPRIKRHFEFKIAMLTAARAEDGADQANKAIEMLDKFKAENADSWQLVPLTRALGRLCLHKEPPDYAAARKAYEDLANAANAPADVKAECTLLVIDLLIQADKLSEAQARISVLPASDPRIPIYRIGVAASSDKIADAVKQLEEFIEKTSDRGLKAAAYNMIGDCSRRDPKLKKDALYAYLWVDVVYNDDAVETAKAQRRLAELFAELKDDERAKKYRDRLRGR